MLSFIAFISESGDTHHPYEKTETKHMGDGRERHKYKFTDAVGSTKVVKLAHSSSGYTADVDFYDKENEHEDGREKYGATHNLGHHAIKTFATIKHILKHHAGQHPKLSSYSFVSTDHEPTRTKLYTRMTKHLGGESEHYPSSSQTEHQVYTKAFK